jgi:HPt (histidine-containing phosphotransfer) domain-containing protein
MNTQAAPQRVHALYSVSHSASMQALYHAAYQAEVLGLLTDLIFAVLNMI